MATLQGMVNLTKFSDNEVNRQTDLWMNCLDKSCTAGFVKFSSLNICFKNLLVLDHSHLSPRGPENSQIMLNSYKTREAVVA